MNDINMKKNDWEEAYYLLDELYSSFRLTYPIYESGKNKQVRENARKEIDFLIMRADNYISDNIEL